MQNYNYTAKDDYGKVVRGTMMADDEIDLANKISKLGYFLIRSKVIAGNHVVAGRKLARMSYSEVLNFTLHLATLLDAGIAMVAALRELAQDEDRQNVQKIIDDIRYRVESGTSLKDALSIHPTSFPKVYTAIVGAGEVTGKLAACLNDLAVLLDWQMELRAKVKEAATYPIILFTVLVGVVTLLVVKLIPVFEPIFKEMKVELPLPTQIVLELSHLVRSKGLVALGVIVLFVIGYKLYNSTTKGRYRIDSLKLKLPLFGQLLRKVSLSRFCHTFALGLRSGVNVLTALDFAAEVVGNSRLQRSVVQARDSVNVGEKLATSFKMSGEFPPLVIRMIGVGEQSGSLIQTLEKVNQFYDREVPQTIKIIFTLIEPLMIVLMAAIVGFIAVAVFMPMFRMADVIGG
ncbi:MAG: type II secretion system F family protein [Candidatus Omnitrophota bacterium]